MNVLVVGFGNMGCRHTQSLIEKYPENKYFIVEPNKDVYECNIKKIDVLYNRLFYYDDILSLPDNIDFAVIATSAFPRYKITQALIGKGVKYFLLEKIVFQSEQQFDEITNLLRMNDCLAYCNFVNRYFPNYIEIKNSFIQGSPMKMIVSGSDFGLGCNALHYVDLFEYITSSRVQLTSSKLVENLKPNRRGSIYKELLGQIIFTSRNGDTLIISADENRVGGNEIVILHNNNYDILNEESRTHVHYSEKKGVVRKEFKILYTSFLTGVIYNDIIHGKSLLPNIEFVKSSHIEFFKAANAAFGLSDIDLCPLT